MAQAKAAVASPSLADWLRRRRKAHGLTQEDVVQALRAIGLTLSRGHFASLEQGRGLKPDHVVALDQVYEAGGELIALAEAEWGHPISSSRQEAWSSLAEAIHADWVELVESSRSRYEELSRLAGNGTRVAPLVADPTIEQARTWWEEAPDGDVIKGHDRIEAAVVYLLTLAAHAPAPETEPPIEFCGAFEGFRQAGRKAGLPGLVRDGVRKAMERAWECRHYIPTHPDDVDSPMLFYVALPLIACRQFSVRTVDLTRVPVVENLLVIPGFAAVQFFATTNTRRIDTAVIHKRTETRQAIENRVKQIASASKEFDVDRFERPRRSDVTANEHGFQELLTGVDAIGGNCYVFAGDLPSSTIPPGVFEAAIKERKKNPPNSTHLDEMVRLHKDRHGFLTTDLTEERTKHQVIVSRAALRRPRDPVDVRYPDYTKVELSLEGQIAHLKNVQELMNDHEELFQVGIVDAEIAERIEQCRWQVRDSGSEGALIVHTRCTPPVNSPLRSIADQPVQVDLKISSPTVIRAFTAFFRNVWRNKTQTDPVRVKAEIDDALTKLEAECKKRSRNASS